VADAAGAFTRFRAVRHFGSLDGLRAISIIGVIWHHGPGQRATASLLQQGFLGVRLFFAISGFLITTLLLREAAATGTISLRNFYARRSLRIFPLYYTVLALYVVLVTLTAAGTPHGREFLGNLPAFLTYTSNWFVGATGATFAYAWSLAAEEQFYCSWPWCERYLSPPWPLVLIGAIATIAIVVSAGWLDALLPAPSFAVTVLRNLMAPIFLGVIAAHLLHGPRSFAAIFRILGPRPVSALLLAALLAAIHWNGPMAVNDILMTALVVSTVVREDHWLAPVLSWPVVVRIGVVSYGMYLLHPLVFNAADRGEQGLALTGLHQSMIEFAAVLLLTFLAAEVSFRYYESRFLALKRRFASTREK
jgi:peptidoglycan/LPS O-acetylase OafA/YrhL